MCHDIIYDLPIFGHERVVVIERTFGKETTTRTWDTVKKAVR